VKPAVLYLYKIITNHRRVCAMKKQILLLLAVALLLSACSATEAVTEYAPKESMRLTVYTSHKEEVYMPIIREFEERTGIWVEVVTGGTSELLEKIESQGDNVTVDVMFGGGVESLEAYEHCFSPYVAVHSDSIQDAFQTEDSIWTPFSALPVVLIYNTKLVRPEMITGWASLEDPAFRGRIAFADPAVSGSSFTALVTRIFAGQPHTDTLLPLAENLKGHMLSSSGDVLTAVADGTYLVGITLEETALKHIAAGEDLALIYPCDGTSCVPDATAMVKGAPHSEHAKKFLDFTVSYEVQQMLSASFYRRPVRDDIPVAQSLVPLQDIALVDYDIGWACKNRNVILSDWSFFLKEAE